MIESKRRSSKLLVPAISLFLLASCATGGKKKNEELEAAQNQIKDLQALTNTLAQRLDSLESKVHDTASKTESLAKHPSIDAPLGVDNSKPAPVLGHPAD